MYDCLAFDCSPMLFVLLTINLDATIREWSRDHRAEPGSLTPPWRKPSSGTRTDTYRIVVAAHNAHMQRCPVSVAGAPACCKLGESKNA